MSFFLVIIFWSVWSNEPQATEAFQDSSARGLVGGPVRAGEGVQGGNAVTHSFKGSVWDSDPFANLFHLSSVVYPLKPPVYLSSHPAVSESSSIS
jgi:hypothetical protein